MGFDMWRFLASPNNASKPPKRQRQKNPDTRLPWFISVIFFVFLVRVLLGSAFLFALSTGFMPSWFTLLIVAHAVAMVVALVFVLNGWGWARLVLLALSVVQLVFDQTLVTRWFLLADALLLAILMIRPAGRYFSRCADARVKSQ